MINLIQFKNHFWKEKKLNLNNEINFTSNFDVIDFKFLLQI